MDKEINEEKEFIQSFALELTNRTLEQREEIGKKYYKQLKRLQAENEQIKKDYAKLHIDFAKCNEENERLKARLRPLEDSYFKGLSSIEIAELAKKSIRITAENRKFEYALQEIREIVSEPCIVDENCQTCNSSCMQKDILAKINEVIGAE